MRKISNGNWKKKSSMFLALAMVATLSIQPVNVRAAAAKSVTAKAITVNVEDDAQVLVTGNTYELKSTEKVTFKSSNPEIATVSKTGVITAKKQGVVTISATTESGKKVTKKLWVVTKAYKTAYQTTLDKMLASDGINRIALRNTKTDDLYVIKKGDYVKKTLYVRTPKSDVKNHATFKLVNIVDVAENTWSEFGKGNYFKITDKKLHFVAEPTAQVNKVNVAGSKSVVNLDAFGVVNAIDVTGASANLNLEVAPQATVKALKVTAKDAKTTIDVDGTISKIVIDSNADVTITGTTGKVVTVEVTENAKGAKITTAVPVKATVASDVTVVLNKGAEGTTLEKASDKITFTVTNQTTQAVVVTTKGSDKKETIAPQTTSTTTPGTPSTSGGSSSGGSNPGTVTPTPAPTTATVKAVFSADSKTVTYTLPTSYDKIKSATISVKGFGYSEEFTLTDKMLEYAKKYMTDEAGYLAKVLEQWKAIENYTRTDNKHTTTITGVKGDLTKKVDVDGRWATVTVDDKANTISAVSRLFNVLVTKVDLNTVKVKGKTNEYTITKDNAKNQIVITSDVELLEANFVTLTVTY